MSFLQVTVICSSASCPPSKVTSIALHPLPPPFACYKGVGLIRVWSGRGDAVISTDVTVVYIEMDPKSNNRWLHRMTVAEGVSYTLLWKKLKVVTKICERTQKICTRLVYCGLICNIPLWLWKIRKDLRKEHLKVVPKCKQICSKHVLSGGLNNFLVKNQNCIFFF